MATDHDALAWFRSFLVDYGMACLGLTVLVVGLASLVLYLVGDSTVVQRFIDRYGLLALFVAFVIEGAMVLYFTPSESLVPAGMVLLASTGDGYDGATLVGIFAVAVSGATLGQALLFVLARRGGRVWLLEKPWFRIERSHLERVDRWFESWGRAAVPVSNALPFTRGMLTVPAGLASMSVREFVTLSAVGTLVFQAWIAVLFHSAIEFGLFDWAGLA